jgi:hypothetical protein
MVVDSRRDHHMRAAAGQIGLARRAERMQSLPRHDARWAAAAVRG